MSSEIRVTKQTADCYAVTEFWGDGDPHFGGKADDWELYRTETGFAFFRPSKMRGVSPAGFPNKQEAVEAAKRAARRPGGTVSVMVYIP